jgi:hypothetical protein
MYLLLLNNHQYSGGVWLLVGAFLYGVLHAIGLTPCSRLPRKGTTRAAVRLS